MDYMMKRRFMNAQATTGEDVPFLETLAAELTDAAYPIDLRHGIAGSWVDLELDLWRVLNTTVDSRGDPADHDLDARAAPLPSGATRRLQHPRHAVLSKAMGSTSQLISALLLAMALISLVVGGVGIMNIMLVSVTERTGEIGLRMAVGTRPRDILRQFLAEAIVPFLLGGAVGIVAGRGVSLSVRTFLHWPTFASLPAILASVGVSATVGVLFGYYPAWKESKLDPIDALRYE
jgi:predicted lysophospholipase L1 biosynthesis ABC-type transport system permease subunit